MKVIFGISASRGIGMGPVFLFSRNEIKVEEKKISDIGKEEERLNAALEKARAQINDVYQKALKESSEADAEIFQAHLMILDDPELLDNIKKQINEDQINAESSVQKATKMFSDMMAAMSDEYFAARANDIKDVGNRLLRNLLGISESPTANLKVPSIIIADDLTPSDTVLLDKSLVIGFCIAQGSATSHTAILARGLGLPAVAGVGNEILQVQNGTKVILDGTNGKVLIDPDQGMLMDYERKIQIAQTIKSEALGKSQEPAVTLDGKSIEVVANIGNVESAKLSVNNGAEGVGLLRTEFLYLERSSLPTEEEQYQVYKAILNEFGSLPVILRTLDVGGDKEIPYMGLEIESNSFLGQRALRLCLARHDIFKPQLKAALRAGKGHNLKMMFPMVAMASEVREAKAVVETCMQELTAEGKEFVSDVEIGIMVEIPSAAILADQLTKEVDFFSIGTNDLSQYTMAADRTNPKVAALSDAFNPAVIRLVNDVIKAAHAKGKWVGMCGELAGEPLAIPILLGLGLDEFSMAPPMIPVAKQIIRNLNTSQMVPLAKQVLNLEHPDEIRSFVKEQVPFLEDLNG